MNIHEDLTFKDMNNGNGNSRDDLRSINRKVHRRDNPRSIDRKVHRKGNPRFGDHNTLSLEERLMTRKRNIRGRRIRS